MFNKQSEFVSAITMVPGIIMSLWWIQTTQWPQYVAMVGYIITCVCSMLFHTTYAINGHANDFRWLRLDIIGQQIGLFCGTPHTVLGPSSFLLLIPGCVICIIADLSDVRERTIAFAFCGINLLLTSSFSLKLMLQWCIAFLFFWTAKVVDTRGFGHIIWHTMCHYNLRCLYNNVVYRL